MVIAIKNSQEGFFLTLPAVKESATPASSTYSGEPVALYLQRIIDTLAGAKAQGIVTIDIRGRSALGDFMVIASGRSQRHVLALADRVVQKLREDGLRDIRTEGMEGGDWILIDTGDVIIHIFHPDMREFYNLEKMWQ